MSRSGTDSIRRRAAPVTVAAVLALTALTACSDPEDPVADRIESPELTATVEAVAAEVHDALGVADDVDVTGARTEGCTDGLGQDDGTVQVVVAGRLVDTDLTTERLDAAAEALGATDVRTSDIEDPTDPGAPPGRQISLFARRDGIRIDVTVRLEDGTLTTTYRSECR